MWSRNVARLKTSNSYYQPTDRFTVPSRLALIRKSCSERGIPFPPTKSHYDVELLMHESETSTEAGTLQSIFGGIVQFLLSIFNLRLGGINAVTTWASEQLGRSRSSVGVQPEEAMETGKLNLSSDDAAGGESTLIGPRTIKKGRHTTSDRWVGKSARVSCYKLPTVDELDEIKICQIHKYAPTCK